MVSSSSGSSDDAIPTPGHPVPAFPVDVVSIWLSFVPAVTRVRSRYQEGGTRKPRECERRPMPEITRSNPSPKMTVAVIKAGPEFQAWFHRFREHLRLPAALLLDQALAELARAR